METLVHECYHARKAEPKTRQKAKQLEFQSSPMTQLLFFTAEEGIASLVGNNGLLASQHPVIPLRAAEEGCAELKQLLGRFCIRPGRAGYLVRPGGFGRLLSGVPVRPAGSGLAGTVPVNGKRIRRIGTLRRPFWHFPPRPGISCLVGGCSGKTVEKQGKIWYNKSVMEGERALRPPDGNHPAFRQPPAGRENRRSSYGKTTHRRDFWRRIVRA